MSNSTGSGAFTRPGRRWVAAATVAAALVLTVAAAEPEATEDSTPSGPYFLQGIDLTQPAQSAFRDWPPDALVERPYWIPWNPLAFQRAGLFDRPVLFVLTVRWNRNSLGVARDLLSDPDVLRAVNKDYISVLVNADRRPDVAERYATGNWPVIAMLTREGTPMLSQANERKVAKPITIGDVDREAMLFLLREGAVYHGKWGNFLLGLGREWAKRESEITLDAGRVDEQASDSLARWMLANADPSLGGFGAAPKHVIPGLSEYAHVRAARQVPALRDHAARTVSALMDGPLHDRRHGGLHRMAAAPDWGAIQYEKLLDRNADWLRELTVSVRLGAGDPESLEAAIDRTVDFLQGTLVRPGGGFYLAQAADPESEDGGGWWRGETPIDSSPPVDRLVLAGPNVLAGAALIRAGIVRDQPDWVDAGRVAIDLVLDRAHRPGSGVRHVVEPYPEEHRFLESQADVAFGLIEAYESTGDTPYLAAARQIVDFASNNLAVPGQTALVDHLEGPAEIGLLANRRWPIRANARIARAMLRLAFHGQGETYRDQATSVMSAFSGDLARYGALGTEAALAVEELIRSPLIVAVEGPAGDPRVASLRHSALRLPWPWMVITTATTDAATEPALVASYSGREDRLVDEAQIEAFAERLRSLSGGDAQP